MWFLRVTDRHSAFEHSDMLLCPRQTLTRNGQKLTTLRLVSSWVHMQNRDHAMPQSCVVHRSSDSHNNAPLQAVMHAERVNHHFQLRTQAITGSMVAENTI